MVKDHILELFIETLIDEGALFNSTVDISNKLFLEPCIYTTKWAMNGEEGSVINVPA